LKIYLILSKNKKMDNKALETVQKDIEEVDRFILDSKRPNIQRILKEQHILLISTLKHEKERLAEYEKNKENTTSSTKVDSKVNYISLNKYAFDNSDKFAKVYFTDDFNGLKNHPKEKITSNFTETSFEVCVMEWKGKNLRFACGNLNKNINATDSYAKATASGLTVYLRKTKQENWDSLEKKQGPMGDKQPNPMGGMGGPGGDNKDDPSAGMMNMMKEMYQNGDDNTKRMISESWQKAQDGKGGEGGMGGMGGMPGMGGMGGQGGMPGMGGMGGMGGQGGMPGMGGMGGMGGQGGMPGMGGMGGGKGGMPDMSKLMESMGGMGGMGGGKGGQGGKPDMSKLMEMMGGMGGMGGGKEGGMPDMSKLADLQKMMGEMGGKDGMPDMGDMGDMGEM
jgi:hypothetical protein